MTMKAPKIDMRSEERSFTPEEWRRVEEIWKGSTTKTVKDCIVEMQSERKEETSHG